MTDMADKSREKTLQYHRDRIQDPRKKGLCLLYQLNLSVKDRDAHHVVCRSCRERNRKEYGRRKKARICVGCGLIRAAKGAAYCHLCNETMNENRRDRRKELVEAGKCAECRGKSDTGGYRCQSCRNDRAPREWGGPSRSGIRPRAALAAEIGEVPTPTEER